MLLDVRPVYVVQDRASGSFVDINMSFVTSLRHAARADTREIANESALQKPCDTFSGKDYGHFSTQ